MKSTKRLLLLIILIALVACGTTPEKYQGEPDIYAVLTTDSLKAKVMIGRTASIDDTLDPVEVIDTFWYFDTFFVDTYSVILWKGTSDAGVVLRSGELELTLEESPDSAGYYWADPVACQPGQTWELEVKYPEGEEIIAKTTLPGSFQITDFDHDTLDFEHDTLRWSTSENAAGYIMRMMIWESWDLIDTVIIDSFLSYLVFLPADTNHVALNDLFLGGDSLRFQVAALDTNDYDYRHFGYYYWTNPRAEDYMHIEGAWGVFGSQVVQRSKTYICPPLDTLPAEK
jgi:hypothetical protein